MKKLLLSGEMDVNCYFIENQGKCYIIDPGYEKEKVIKYVKDNNWEVMGILLTHGHRDHIGAIDAFKVPVYIHEKEYGVLEENYKNVFKEKTYDLKDINIVKINESKIFPIGDKNIQVIYTPGHTIGGVCYKFGHDLYTGDTLFKGRVGKWIFPTGDLNLLKKSIINLIENQNENSSISDNDLHEFHQDISDYIQMRTEKWLLPRLKEKQDPET